MRHITLQRPGVHRFPRECPECGAGEAEYKHPDYSDHHYLQQDAADTWQPAKPDTATHIAGEFFCSHCQAIWTVIEPVEEYK